MSMHKKPLTDLERDGLRAHGLSRVEPSQLSDAFRSGMAWVQPQLDAALEQNNKLKAALENIDKDLESRNFLENSSLRDTVSAALAIYS